MSCESSGPNAKRVHVPSCRDAACKEFMNQLVEKLEQEKVPCVFESRGDYGPGGLYSQRFSKFFAECSCTVIHVCEDLLRKIKRVEHLLKEEPEKSYFIRIPTSPSDDSDFLLDFNVLDMSSDEAQQNFYRDLVRLNSSDEQASPVTQVTSAGQAQSDADGENDYIYNADIAVPDTFKSLEPVLRNKDNSKPLIVKSRLTFEPTAEIKDILADPKELAQKKQISIDLPHLCHVVLPDLYTKKDIISLAHLSCSQNLKLRFHALCSITLLLYEQGLHGFSHQVLQKTEDVLFTVIEHEKYKSLNSDLEFRDDFACAELLVIVYLIACVMCLVSCDHSENKCYMHVVSKRDLFHIKKTASLPNLLKGKSGPAQHPEWVRVLACCFTQWKHKTCPVVSNLISDIVKTSKAQDVDEKLVPELQLPVLIASFIQSFGDSRPTRFLRVLQLLSKHSSRKSRDPTQKELKRIIVSTAVFGLNIFLQHRTEHLTSSDSFGETCQETVGCLDKMLKRLDVKSQRQCLCRMTSLLFHNNKAVRQHTSCLFRQQFFYHDHLWELLLLETTFILWPFLKFSKIDSSSLETHHNWRVLPCKFARCSVLIHIHHPTATNHLRKNSGRDRSMQQNRYFRELTCLIRLQHASIVEMVAYHMQCCPQFYITEDYLTKTWQTVLVNRSKNSDWFSMCRLLQMLIEALEGIQFCHSHDMVHRDLTAASFFISSQGRIKLANFKLSRKLAGKNCIRDFDCTSIPTRWSAPESLRLCFFSIASDIWMTGHLMYEVLTHGRLPYADVAKPDQELMAMVVKGEKTLCYEPCIPTNLRAIIQQLTSVKEADRGLQIEEVASKIQTEIQEMNNAKDTSDEHFFFPTLNTSGQAATECEKGLVLSLVEDYQSPSTDDQAGSLDGSCETPLELDESGYINFGPQKGLTHFREPCPPDFRSEEWSALTQDPLPGITQMIGHPVKNASGQTELPFAIPSQSLCSLRDAVLTRWLGQEIGPYIVCLRQLATVILQLHLRGLILCDFAPDTVHVEKFPGSPPRFKVWVTSLPSIKLLPELQNTGSSKTERYVHLDCPQGADKRRRAAGEVLQYGQYSTASDAYCYSMLALWVFNAFEVTSDGQAYERRSLSPLDKIPESEVYANVAVAYNKPMLARPACCPQHIYQLLKECWQTERHERPCMQILEAYMTLHKVDVALTADDLQRESGEFIQIDNVSDLDSESMYEEAVEDEDGYQYLPNEAHGNTEINSSSSEVYMNQACNSQQSDTNIHDEEVYIEHEHSQTGLVAEHEESVQTTRIMEKLLPPLPNIPIPPIPTKLSDNKESGTEKCDASKTRAALPLLGQKPSIAPKPRKMVATTHAGHGPREEAEHKSNQEFPVSLSGSVAPSPPPRTYTKGSGAPIVAGGSGLEEAVLVQDPGVKTPCPNLDSPPVLPPRTYRQTGQNGEEPVAQRSAPSAGFSRRPAVLARLPPPIPDHPPPLPRKPPPGGGTVRYQNQGGCAALSDVGSSQKRWSQKSEASEDAHIYEDL